MTQQPALAPVSPEVRARHKRQNRIIIAVIVAVLVPVLSVTLANRYVDQALDDWRSHPTFPFNTTAEVDLSPGDYVVWTYFSKADCTVSFDGQQMATTVPPSQSVYESQGIYQSARFSASTSGTYSVICTGDSSGGYAMVSTPSPVATATIVRLLGYVLAVGGVITGVILFIVALITNANEKKYPSHLSI